MNLRQFDGYNNSIHEGTNRGPKYNTAPVGSCTKIEKAMAIICNNVKPNGK